MADFRFGTVGAPPSTPKKPGGSVGAVIRLREMDMDAFELGWVQSVRVSPETCAQIRATAQEHDVAISVHAPYFFNLNAVEEEWPKSRKRLMDAAHYGNLAGATDIIFHPGSYFGAQAEDVLPAAIERLAGCVEELRAQGNPVTLRPETMGKAALLGSLSDTLAMSRAMRGVEPCLDFAHLHARYGDGSMNTYTEFHDALAMYADALGEEAVKRLHIHLSGIEYGPKGEKEHISVEAADLDYRALFRALRAFKAGGRIVCESPLTVLESDVVVLRKLWEEICAE